MGRHSKKHVKRSRVAFAAAPVVASLPFLGAMGTAQADTKSVWDKLAFCESTNNWSINTGNGYYGGLQFSPSTWRAFGGTKYASSAHRATKSQQIETAIKVQKVQGWGAWPGCNKKLGGLANHVQPGDMSIKAGGSTERASRSTARTSTQSSSTKSSATKSTSTKKSSVKSASRVKVASKRVTTKVVKKHSTKTHVVKSGDTLSGIAQYHGVLGGWQALYQINAGKLASPHEIYPGDLLRLVAA